MRKEATAQAQRQLKAAGRRHWKLLTPRQRQQWQKWAREAHEQGERRRSVVHTTVNLAASLAQLIDAHELT